MFDVFADIDLRKEIDEHKRTGASVTISLTHVENPCEFGIARLDDTGKILEFKEKPKPEEVFSDLVNAGVYVVEKEMMGYVPKGKMYDFSKELTMDIMSKGYRVQGHMLNGIWMDVGRPSDLLRANILMAERRSSDAESKDAVKGSKITRPFYIGDNGRAVDSEITSSVISKGSVIKGSIITNSLVMADCDISHASVTGSIIGERCVIKQGAKITNAVIADGTVIEKNETIETT